MDHVVRNFGEGAREDISRQHGSRYEQRRSLSPVTTQAFSEHLAWDINTKDNQPQTHSSFSNASPDAAVHPSRAQKSGSHHQELQSGYRTARGRQRGSSMISNLSEISAPSPASYAAISPSMSHSRKVSSSMNEQEGRDLNELAAPSPAQPESPSHTTNFSRRAPHMMREEEEKDIDELAAPLPIQRNEPPGSDYRSRRVPSSMLEEEEEDLDELAAPPPAQSFAGQQYLDDSQVDEDVEPDSGRSKVSGFATQLYIVSYLIFFSFLGTLARLGMEWLTFYPGAPVVMSIVWANFGGCLIMGFLSEDHRLFREQWGTTRDQHHDLEKTRSSTSSFTSSKKAAHGKVKKTIPLFIGLTTGFCGSFTSFSTFARDMYLAIANSVPTPLNHPIDTSTSSTTPRNDGYSLTAVLAVIILTLTVNAGALKFGAHLAIWADSYLPTLPFWLLRNFIDRLVVFLAFGCWLAAILLAALPPDRPGGSAGRSIWAAETWRGEVLFALIFSPVGCLLRFLLSLRLNGLVAWFPLGTFCANVFGVAVLAMSYDLQHARLLGPGLAAVGGGRVGCQVLQGVEDGFCGCLTTVSTWILELTTLRRKHAYLYGAVSIGVALGVVIVVMGSVQWSVGFQAAACATVTS